MSYPPCCTGCGATLLEAHPLTQCSFLLHIPHDRPSVPKPFSAVITIPHHHNNTKDQAAPSALVILDTSTGQPSKSSTVSLETFFPHFRNSWLLPAPQISHKEFSFAKSLFSAQAFNKARPDALIFSFLKSHYFNLLTLVNFLTSDGLKELTFLYMKKAKHKKMRLTVAQSGIYWV